MPTSSLIFDSHESENDEPISRFIFLLKRVSLPVYLWNIRAQVYSMPWPWQRRRSNHPNDPILMCRRLRLMIWTIRSNFCIFLLDWNPFLGTNCRTPIESANHLNTFAVRQQQMFVFTGIPLCFHYFLVDKLILLLINSSLFLLLFIDREMSSSWNCQMSTRSKKYLRANAICRPRSDSFIGIYSNGLCIHLRWILSKGGNCRRSGICCSEKQWAKSMTSRAEKW